MESTKVTFSQQIEQSLVNLPVWTGKKISGSNKDRILKAVQKFIDDGGCNKYDFMIEIEGETIKKYKNLTLAEMKEWNDLYYSKERIKLRNDKNK